MSSQPAARRELSVTRFIDASPQTVYRVWTERLGEWWAPRPYTTPNVDIDLRPGGRALMGMMAPDGTAMEAGEGGVFLEIVPDRKIVFTTAFTAGWVPADPFMVVIVTFDPEGSGTRYTAVVRHWTDEQVTNHEAMGFHEGWGIVAGQLADLAETEARAAAGP